MIINHNLQSMNAHRQMGVNATSNASSMEKLSSGMRINRAGDDAAGLSISEKMRAQVNGLNQGSRNAQDGISMIQTAEGALDETHSILQRMRELSVQATTDTNDDQDRDAIQAEIDALTEEIDRISETTEFNGRTLLDNDEKITLQVGSNSGQHIDVSLEGMGAKDLVKKDTVIKYNCTGITAASPESIISRVETTLGFSLDRKEDGSLTDNAVLVAKGLGTTYIGGVEKEGSVRTSTEFRSGEEGFELTDVEKAMLLEKLAANSYSDAKYTALVDSDGKIRASKLEATITAIGGGCGKTTAMQVNAGVDVTSSSRADSAIKTLDEAIKKVSTFRSELGATQNRLEHTIKNLDNAAENTQAAESRIRDVDMAEEMMEFTRTNVLQQASQSMLAQANQKPNQVLQLLG